MKVKNYNYEYCELCGSRDFNSLAVYDISARVPKARDRTFVSCSACVSQIAETCTDAEIEDIAAWVWDRCMGPPPEAWARRLQLRLFW